MVYTGLATLPKLKVYKINDPTSHHKAPPSRQSCCADEVVTRVHFEKNYTSIKALDFVLIQNQNKHLRAVA